jgi:hypothetical protein
VGNCRKLLLNLAIKFSDFINAGETTVTTATKTIKEPRQLVGEKWKLKKWWQDKGADETLPPLTTFGEEISSFEVVSRYLCSYTIGNASSNRLNHSERKRQSCSSFIMPNQQSRYCFSVVKGNIQITYTCSSFCIYILLCNV